MRHLAILAAALAISVGFASTEPIGPIFGPAPVLEVLDGDTVVLGSNLGPRTVRLIGIDTPEVRHPEIGREPYGPEASSFTANLLPEGTWVWVELDLEIEDAYGRLLAYVYINNYAGDWLIEGEPASMVNLMIAAAGYARVLSIEPNLVYADLFEQAVQQAQTQEAGMWTSAGTGTSPQAESRSSTLPPGDIIIACTLYDPDVENEVNAETVTLLLRTTIDTRGYYLHDQGSGTRLFLPIGEHGPGELEIRNPNQGIWNNSGDTIYLMRGNQTIDAWDYTDQRPGTNGTICRDDP